MGENVRLFKQFGSWDRVRGRINLLKGQYSSTFDDKIYAMESGLNNI